MMELLLNTLCSGQSPQSQWVQQELRKQVPPLPLQLSLISIFVTDIFIATGLCVPLNWPATHLLSGCGCACCPFFFVWRKKTPKNKNTSKEYLAYHATLYLLESSYQGEKRESALKGVMVQLTKTQSHGMGSSLCIPERTNDIMLN